MLAGIGIALGLLIGTAPALPAMFYGDALPIALAVEPHPVPLMLAALAWPADHDPFILWPLGRAALVSPAELLARASHRGERLAGLALRARRRFGGPRAPRSRHRRIRGACNHGRDLGAGIVADFRAALRLWAAGFQRLAARCGAQDGPELALALANIAGPAWLARPVTVSLALRPRACSPPSP